MTLPMFGSVWTFVGSMSSWSRNFSIRFTDTAAWFSWQNSNNSTLSNSVQNNSTALQPHKDIYRIYSRISCPAYKPTPIPASDNLAKTSDPCISRYSGNRQRTSTLDLCTVTPCGLRKSRLQRRTPTHPARTRMSGDVSTRHNASRRTGMQTQQQQFVCGPCGRRQVPTNGLCRGPCRANSGCCDKPTPKAISSKFSWKLWAYTWVYTVI